MREQKYHIYLTEQERSEVIKSLIDLKNTLIRQGKYTDAVDDVLVKLTGAKRKKLKVEPLIPHRSKRLFSFQVAFPVKERSLKRRLFSSSSSKVTG